MRSARARFGRLAHGLRLAAAASLAAFFQAGGPSQAAALAFYALLAAIPLLFLMIVLYGAVAGESWSAQMLLRRQLADAAPFIDEVLVRRVRRLVWASPGMTWQSVLFILWSSWLFIGELRRALALPWRESRPAVRTWPGRLAGVLRGAVAGTLFVVAVSGVLFCAHLPRLSPPGSLFRELSAAWGVACLTGLFSAVYLLFLPGRRPLRAMLGLCAVLAMAAYGVSLLFVGVVARLPRYHMVYGSLSGAVLFLLWLNYNAGLVLWGAWFLRIWQRDHARAAPRRRLALAGWLRRVRPWRKKIGESAGRA